MFAEESDGFILAFVLALFVHTFRPINWCVATIIHRIHIRTFGDKQFDNFLVTFESRKMQRSPSIISLRIHVRTVGKKQFGDFLLTGKSRKMQRSPSIVSLRIHIRASSDVLFDGFNISLIGSIVN